MTNYERIQIDKVFCASVVSSALRPRRPRRVDGMHKVLYCAECGGEMEGGGEA